MVNTTLLKSAMSNNRSVVFNVLKSKVNSRLVNLVRLIEALFNQIKA